MRHLHIGADGKLFHRWPSYCAVILRTTTAATDKNLGFEKSRMAELCSTVFLFVGHVLTAPTSVMFRVWKIKSISIIFPRKKTISISIFYYALFQPLILLKPITNFACIYKHDAWSNSLCKKFYGLNCSTRTVPLRMAFADDKCRRRRDDCKRQEEKNNKRKKKKKRKDFKKEPHEKTTGRTFANTRPRPGGRVSNLQ